MRPKTLVDVPLDEVGKLAESYIEHHSVVENAKKALLTIQEELIMALRKAKRRDISFQTESRTITLEVVVTSAKEKIKIKK